MVKYVMPILCAALLGASALALEKRADDACFVSPAPNVEQEEALDVTSADFDPGTVLHLEAYTYELDEVQLGAKAFLRAHGAAGGPQAERQAIAIVRSQEEAEQVAAAYGAALLTYSELSHNALLELPDTLSLQSWILLSAREDVPLPALEPNRMMQLY